MLLDSLCRMLLYHIVTAMSNLVTTLKHTGFLKSLPPSNILPPVVGLVRCRGYSTYSAFTPETKVNEKTAATRGPFEDVSASTLARLPTKSILRNLVLSSFFISPILFRPGFAILRKVANSQSAFWNPDSNPLLRFMIKPLVYDQFCAGTNQAEIQRTRDTIKRIGFSGVILCYGKELVVSQSNQDQITNCRDSGEDAGIEHWKKGNLETLDMVGEGDWIGIK